MEAWPEVQVGLAEPALGGPCMEAWQVGPTEHALGVPCMEVGFTTRKALVWETSWQGQRIEGGDDTAVLLQSLSNKGKVMMCASR